MPGKRVFLYATETDDGVDSRCTSVLPTRLNASLASYYGVEVKDDGPLDKVADELPVDLAIWDHIPVGSVRLSDRTEDQSCQIEGTVNQKNDEGTPATGVPLYFAEGGSNQEIHVITDNQGKFAFTHIPPIRYQADGWPEDKVTGGDMYFLGVIAGKRRPVPEYLEYEANTDYHFRCRELPDGSDHNRSVGTGVPGDLDNGLESKTLTLDPLLKLIKRNTVLTVTLPDGILGDGFGVEIHSADTTTSDNIGGGGWIMETIDADNDRHPFITQSDKIYTVSELAGGDYLLRAYFPDLDNSDRWVECDSDSFTVAAGSTKALTASLEEPNEGSESSNCRYTDTDGSGNEENYHRRLVVAPTTP